MCYTMAGQHVMVSDACRAELLAFSSTHLTTLTMTNVAVPVVGHFVVNILVKRSENK